VAYVDSTSVRLVWGASGNVTFFVVRLSVDGINFSPLFSTKPITQPTATASGLQQYSQYYFQEFGSDGATSVDAVGAQVAAMTTISRASPPPSFARARPLTGASRAPRSAGHPAPV
jgi:hypothetical protein